MPSRTQCQSQHIVWNLPHNGLNKSQVHSHWCTMFITFRLLQYENLRPFLYNSLYMTDWPFFPFLMNGYQRTSVESLVIMSSNHTVPLSCYDIRIQADWHSVNSLPKRFIKICGVVKMNQTKICAFAEIRSSRGVKTKPKIKLCNKHNKHVHGLSVGALQSPENKWQSGLQYVVNDL